MIPQIKFYLLLRSDLPDLNFITDKLQIEPNFSHHIGEPMSFSQRQHNHSSWGFGTDYEDSYDLNDQISVVYQKLLPVKDKLKNILKDNDITATFESVIKMFGTQTAGIGLEKYIIDFASELGIEFDFDMYLYTEEEAEELKQLQKNEANKRINTDRG